MYKFPRRLLSGARRGEWVRCKYYSLHQYLLPRHEVVIQFNEEILFIKTPKQLAGLYLLDNFLGLSIEGHGEKRQASSRYV